jgi:integrase
MAYTFYYEDFKRADGSFATRKVRHSIGRVGNGAVSERSARREHARIMEEVNRKRGSVAPAVKGQTFQDAVDSWRSDVAPHLSPSTVRQRESYLRQHIVPRFGDSSPHALTVASLQQFATELQKTVSRKTIVNVLGTAFAILKYAGRCGALVSKVTFSDIELGSEAHDKRAAFFTREQVAQIVDAAREPYKTMFAMAFFTGLRAGELLALRVGDIDFSKKTIRVERSADDNTRQIRQPKTKNSTATLPMPSALEALLKTYLASVWKANPSCLLFPNRKGTNTRWRDNVVKYGLKPVLRKLGIPAHNVGLHAFRHGLATELAESSVPLPVLQNQMRHADVRTTLRVYAHVIPATQRAAMEAISIRTNSTNVPVGTNSNA